MEEKFCKICGDMLSNDDLFCTNCGSAVDLNDNLPTAQLYDVRPQRKSTAFKGLYISSKILGIISLIDSISNILFLLFILLLLYAYSTSSGIGDAFFLVLYSVCTFGITLINSITTFIMSIVSIALGGKIKRRDPNDPGVKVARPAKVALVFTIITLVVLIGILAVYMSNKSFNFN